MYIHVPANAYTEARNHKRASDPLELEVTDTCESFKLGIEKNTQVPCKNIIGSEQSLQLFLAFLFVCLLALTQSIVSFHDTPKGSRQKYI